MTEPRPGGRPYLMVFALVALTSLPTMVVVGVGSSRMDDTVTTATTPYVSRRLDQPVVVLPGPPGVAQPGWSSPPAGRDRPEPAAPPSRPDPPLALPPAGGGPVGRPEKAPRTPPTRRDPLPATPPPQAPSTPSVPPTPAVPGTPGEPPLENGRAKVCDDLPWLPELCTPLPVPTSKHARGARPREGKAREVTTAPDCPSRRRHRR